MLLSLLALVLVVNSKKPVVLDDDVDEPTDEPIEEPETTTRRPPKKTTRKTTRKPTTPKPKPSEKCGKPSHIPNDFSTEIGVAAVPNSWPWMVLILIVIRNQPQPNYMSGTIINEQYIISAAGPLLNADAIYVIPGGHFFDPTISHGIKVSKFITHPNLNTNAWRNNIALLKLSKPLKFNDKIMPVCLNKKAEIPEPEVGSFLTLTGWGQVVQIRDTPDLLRESHVALLEKNECRVRDGGDVDDSQQCVGYINPENRECFIDYGEPTVHLDDNTGKYYLFGLVSDSLCNDQLPITKVDFYLDWIQQTIKQ